MTSIIDTVRRLVGRRHQITRQEMVDILLALELDPARSTITGRGTDGRLHVGDKWVDDPADERRAVATAWERACRDITCISVMHDRDGIGVRYDEPGSMHPMQQAELIFVAEALGGYEYDQIGQMRRHAKRLLIVRGEPSVDPPHSPQIPAWIARLRKHPRVDGAWVRVHDDGTLEMRDPNSGQGADPEHKPRYQYRLDPQTGCVMQRTLPPASVGDAWQDIGVPEWERGHTPPDDELMYRWLEEQVQ